MQPPGIEVSGSVSVRSTIVLATSRPAVTRPNTVKPPFWSSSIAALTLLSVKLMNHSLVALLMLSGVGGCPGGGPSLAIAIVPSTFERHGSLSIEALRGIEVKFTPRCR